MERNISSTGSSDTWGEGKPAGSSMDEPREKAQEAMSQVREKTGETAEQAREQAEAGRERAASGLGRAAEMVREKTGETSGLPQEAGVKVAESMESAAGYLQEHSTTEIWHDVEGYVREHPGQALAGAIAAGFVVGRILR